LQRDRFAVEATRQHEVAIHGTDLVAADVSDQRVVVIVPDALTFGREQLNELWFSRGRTGR
jgi:hypothetical protein